jgi:anthranilate phosphoribosyltransferase
MPPGQEKKMNLPQTIKAIGRRADDAPGLDQEQAQQLYGAMLDGGVPDLELGALLLGLRIKGESFGEMLGFLAAVDERTHSLQLPPGRVRPVVLPTYNGGRKEANLTPLLALLLQRFGVPVLVHGLLEDFGRVTSALIFRELGVLPQATPAQAQAALTEQGLAFVPLPALCPGLHTLLALRGRMGVRNSAHSLVKLLDPFRGGAALVAAATHPAVVDLMRDLMLARGQRGLLLRGSEGEPYANPKRQPRLEIIQESAAKVLCETDHDSLRTLPNLPDGNDAPGTAAWTRRVLDKQIPLPKPITNQLAGLLLASGHAETFAQAGAGVASEFTG